MKGKRTTVLRSIARKLRRVQDHEQMKWLVTQAEGEILDDRLCRQLCILYEHDLKEPELALRFAAAQIQKLEKYRGLRNRYHHLFQEWSRRRDRLVRKVRGQRVRASGMRAGSM